MGWFAAAGLVCAAGIALAQQECMQECMKNFVAVSQRKELRPLYVVTTDVTLAEAQQNMEEVCEYVRKGLDCMKKCDGGAMVVAMMERSGPTDVCLSKREEFLQYAIQCEVDNREAIREECGIDKLQHYVMILENLKQLLKVLAVNPEKAASTEFKEEFGEVCEYSSIIARCTTKVYRSKCTPQAQALTMGLLKKSLGATSPQQLGAIHWKCEQMAFALAEIEKEWEGEAPLPQRPEVENPEIENAEIDVDSDPKGEISGSRPNVASPPQSDGPIGDRTYETGRREGVADVGAYRSSGGIVGRSLLPGGFVVSVCGLVFLMRL